MTIVLYDSIDVSQIPADAPAVAGYTSGNWPTWASLAARFPHAHRLSIAVTADANAMVLDIENGDATVASASGWYERQKALGLHRPCFYANASTMSADLIPAIQAARIPRSSLRLWSAHYTGRAHICGPSTCKATSISMDGTQWTSSALGRNLDESLLLSNFFDTEVSMQVTKLPPGDWRAGGPLILIGPAPDGSTWETKTYDGETWTTPVKQ